MTATYRRYGIAIGDEHLDNTTFEVLLRIIAVGLSLYLAEWSPYRNWMYDEDASETFGDVFNAVHLSEKEARVAAALINECFLNGHHALATIGDWYGDGRSLYMTREEYKRRLRVLEDFHFDLPVEETSRRRDSIVLDEGFFTDLEARVKGYFAPLGIEFSIQTPVSKWARYYHELHRDRLIGHLLREISKSS